MRRENRRKTNSNTTIYITIGALILAVATFVITFVVYSNKLDSEMYSFDSEQLARYTDSNNNENDAKTASSSIGKNITESTKNNNTNNLVINNATENSKNENNKNENNKDIKKDKNKDDILKSKEDPKFEFPIEGEISKEFAQDSLIYSETLKEWTTHLGIDIKAEKASVVKSAADGIVKYIKNDPRYGLTIIIDHSNGFQTLYANLLTTDFISEGEKVMKGQTIGTVGESSVYEIVDESHLHFEILKNEENVNPCDFIK